MLRRRCRSRSAGEAPGQPTDEVADLVAYPAVVVEGFFWRGSRFFQLGWIRESDMHDGGFATGEDRAVLVGMTADGYDDVEVYAGIENAF